MNTNYRETNTDQLRLDSYARKLIKKEIRSYEVSLWALQDDFITVLKWSDVEQKGRIEKPIFTINIDGTEKLTFSIPMYYRVEGKLVENPNWYNTQNGNLITGLRKLKVIFNKATEDEMVFEFVITKVAEDHEKDITTCNIEAEGLAFQELGKLGYKIALSQERFELQYKDWAEKGQWFMTGSSTPQTDEPLQTIDYWCAEAGIEKLPVSLSQISGSISLINPRKWYYTVEMNWKSFDNKTARNSATMYEEPYTSSWTNDLTPVKQEEYKEKARAVSVEKSNLYNITQNIAEKFEVFCRYVYLHDENYHIVGRIIVFYNSFLQEDNGLISFTYPYSSSKVNRTMECADVTTKLFVLNAEDQTTLEGYNTIMNSPVNASKEDYILNFDYMLQTKAINQQQFDYIKEYEKKMAAWNDKLNKLQNRRNSYQVQLPKIKAQAAIAENSVALDEEQININNALLNRLDTLYGNEANGLVEVTNKNPDYFLITRRPDKTPYINLTNTNKGISESTIKIHSHYGFSNDEHTLSGEITNYKLVKDDNDNLKEIEFLDSNITAENSTITKVYLTYSYDPHLYYEKIVQTWRAKLAQDQAKALTYPSQVSDLEGKLEAVEEEINNLTVEKETEVHYFEHMMGPALREGYWQPENYNDYGDHKNYSSVITTNDITTDTEIITAWDSILFDDENSLDYEIGVDQRLEYYPCVNLNALFNNGIPTDLSKYSIVWKANNMNKGWDDIKNLQICAVNSQAIVRFLKIENNRPPVTPVLVVVGAKNFAPDQLERMIVSGEARLEKYETHIDNSGNITISHGTNTEIKTIGDNWYCYKSSSASKPDLWSENLWNKFSAIGSVKLVYPRIKISSLALKTSSDQLVIKYDNQLLNLAEDYYINVRDTERTVSGETLTSTDYYITIKPETLVKLGYSNNKEVNVNYVLSNANTSIYLDALKVSKENAYPKVSYEVNVNVINEALAHTLYKRLAQVVMINDTELKFENVFGYISQLELDLDNVQNDKVEVKNYKTKFEDLFSTIVAQTESLKRAGTSLGAAVSGEIPMEGEAFSTTLDVNANILQGYLDSHFDSSQVVKDRLTSLFDEAGTILSNSNKALDQIQSLTLENASILAGFAQKVQNELTTQVYKGEKPTKFKVGDIWIDNDGNRYVATSSSNDSNTSGTAGFVRTYDGTLASITGASMNINADEGIIDILAQNEINIKSGNNVYIAAKENIDIVGNKKVNIGGTEINLCSLYEKQRVNGNLVDTETLRETTGINLIAGVYDFDEYGNYAGDSAHVFIKPERIEMAAAELELKSSSKINLLASTGPTENTSAISIDADKGVWIGAGAGVRLFGSGHSPDERVYVGPVHDVKFRKDDYWIETSNISGHYEYDGENGNSFYTGFILDLYGHATLDFTIKNIWKAINNYTDVNNVEKNNYNGWQEQTASNKRNAAINIIKGYGAVNGASMELNGDHILLGYANVNKSGTAIEMTDEFVIIAAGSQISGNVATDNNKIINGIPGGLIGAKFTQNSIGMAVTTSGVTTAMLMDRHGFTVGSGGINVTTDDFQQTYNNEGSYLRIAPKGIEFGSLADLYINTNNFKLQTNAIIDAQGQLSKETVFAIGNDLQSIGIDTTISNGHFYDSNNTQIQNNGVEPTVNFLVNKSGAYINGTVYATAGSFTGAIHATSFVTSGNDASLQQLNRLLNGDLEDDLQKQIDDDIETWTGKGTPKPLGINNGNWDNTYTLAVVTSNTTEWGKICYISNTAPTGTEVEKTRHVGDVYYDISNTGTGGQAFRYVKDGNNFYWQTLGDTMTTSIAASISSAQTDIINLANGTKPIKGYFSQGNTILFSQLSHSTGLTILGQTNDTGNNYVSIFRASSDRMGFFGLKNNSSLSSILSQTSGEYVFNETNFDNNTDALLWYKRGNLYLAGTLYASKIMVGDETSSQTWDNYFTNLIANNVPDVSPTLTSLFNEAGTILTTAQRSLTELDSLTITNSSILNNFITSAKTAQTQKIEWCVASGSGNNQTYTSAVRIDPNEGIWMGSTKAIKFFSTFPTTSDQSSATLDIAPERILLGAQSGTDSASVSIKPSQILLAVSGVAATGATTHITETTTTSGVQIQKDYIGMATGTGTDRSLVSLSPSRILIGTGFTADPGTGQTINGSYILIENKVIDSSTTPVTRAACFEIGSTGIFKVLSQNFLVNNNAQGTDSIFRLGISDATHDPIMEYKADGTFTLNAADQIWMGVKNATANNTTGIKITDNSLRINAADELVVRAGNELYLSGTDGRIQFAKHKLFNLSVLPNDCISIIEEGIILGDYVYLEAKNETDQTTNTTNGYSNGIWQLKADATTDAKIAWEAIILRSSYNTDAAWEDAYGQFMADEFNADSFSILIERDGTIKCQRLECYGDIYCYGKIYSNNNMVVPIPENQGTATNVDGNSLLSEPITFTI